MRKNHANDVPVDADQVYILDTNIIVDYPDIIPDIDDPTELDSPTLDLSRSHIVIPTAVIRELSSFKKENSDRGKAARQALKRLRKMSEKHMPNRLYGNQLTNNYTLNNRIEFREQVFSIMPIHKNFTDQLPFSPSDDDMDGQIILAALSVIHLVAGCKNDGSYDINHKELTPAFSKVTLLTNDNGLASRANARGVITKRFGCKTPPPYTGRRDLVVPSEMFKLFVSTGSIDLKEWNSFMPDEPDLIANEFIIMSPDDGKYPTGYSRERWEHIGRYDSQSEQIIALQYIFSYPGNIQNAGQAIYAEALMDPDIPLVIATGPAGSGKTYMPTIAGYAGCKNGQFIGVTVVPCYTNRSELGALPGDLDDKLDPDVAPIKNALRNFLMRTDETINKRITAHQKFGDTNAPTREEKELARRSKDKSENSDRDSCQQGKKSIRAKLGEMVDLIWDNWFTNIYIENARGLSFLNEFVLYDEFQDQSRSQADTLLKRIGEHGKMVIAGDIAQIHAAYNDKYNNGIVYATELMKDDFQVARVSFIESEVVRHRLVRLIAERQAKIKIH